MAILSDIDRDEIEEGRIRIAEQGDAKPIADMIKRHFEEDYMGFATFDEKYIKNKMKIDHFLVAEREGKVVGCIRVAIIDFDLGEIRTLCVDEPYRRKGIARELFDRGIELLKERNVRKVIAKVKSRNSPSLNLYEKNGFQKEGHFREHFRKGIDIVQLFKFL